MKRFWFALIIVVISSSLCLAGSDKVTINAGALKTDLLSNGLMGDTTANFNNPAGFFPYHDHKSLLKIGSLWLGGLINGKVGVSAGYVDGNGIISSEWISDDSLVQSSIPGVISPLELNATFMDTDPAVNQGIPLGIKAGLTVHQWSYSPIDRFYILNYDLHNTGEESVDSLYAGIYHLPNIIRDAVNNSSNLDFCGYDNSSDPINGGPRNLLWTTADSVSIANGFGVNPSYLGIRLLQATGPTGSSYGISGASSWSGLRMEPYSDADPLNPYSKYYYLTRSKFDAGDIRKVNVPATTTDSTAINLFGQVITAVEGVWDVNDTNHLGTNYYTGGSFDAEKGLIQLGTPKAVNISLIQNEESWPLDSLTLTVSVTPVANVDGVYDNPLDTGINYYAGGSFDPATGAITLGTPYFGGAQLYVNYYKYINNVSVSYNYYYSKTITTPWDSYTLQIDPSAIQSVEGVFWAKDSSCIGTNYYTGGTFDKSSGMIGLGTAIDEDTMVYDRYATQMFDPSYNPSDDTTLVWWMDPSKIVEILAVYDESNVDHYPGGSYDPASGIITLGIPFAAPGYDNVWVSYRYVATPNVWVKYYKPELSAKNTLASVGPWNMQPGDSAKVVFAVVAGNNLEELRAASDSAKFIWDNPSAAVTTGAGSMSGLVQRTNGRGPVAGAKVVAYQGTTPVDSSQTDVNGRYFIGNITAGAYDSIQASAANYQSAKLDNITVIAGQDTPGNELTLTSYQADLSGTIVRSDGITPVVNAKIFIKGSNADSAASNTVGYYQFTELNVTSGDTLILMADNCLIDTVPGLSLAGDSTQVYNHIMHSLSGWIDGRITKLDGVTPIPGALIKAATVSDTLTTAAGVDGKFSLGGLTAGSYNILVSADWFASDSMPSVFVSTDSTSFANLSLKQANNLNSIVWQKKSAMPYWRYGSAAVVVGGKLYLFGGRDYLGATNTVYCYDPAADTLGGDPWASKTAMSSARYGLGAAAVGDSIIYVIGGYDNDSIPLSTTEAYKPGTDTWVNGLPDMPTPRAFLGVASISDTVYAAGGMNSLAAGLDTVEAYLPTSNIWIAPKALLGGDAFGRSGIGFASVDSFGIKRVHSIGGRKLDGTILQTHMKYNPVTNAWVSRTAIPWLVAFGALAPVNDSLYMVGGRNVGDGFLNKVGAYNPFANNWSTMTECPIVVAYHSAVGQDSMGLWVIGGKTSDLNISDQLYFGYKPGGITGMCTTTTSGPLVGAIVSAACGSQVKNTEATDINGYYTLAGLEPGNYQVRIYKAGVMDTTISDVAVKWGQVTTAPTITGVLGGKPPLAAAVFALQASYPNPSRGQCNINFQIPANSRVELSIYNVLGQRIKTLVSGQKAAGSYSVKWAGDDSRGQAVANGIYIYRLQMDNGKEAKTATRKLVLLK